MPGRPAADGTNYLGLAYLLLVLAVAFVPMLLRRPAPPTDPADSGPDDGSGPPRSPIRPNSPPDGVPLPDAVPARTRLRDHDRLADRVPGRPPRRGVRPSRRRVRGYAPPSAAGPGEHP
jgi:hypothetical protein